MFVWLEEMAHLHKALSSLPPEMTRTIKSIKLQILCVILLYVIDHKNQTHVLFCFWEIGRYNSGILLVRFG